MKCILSQTLISVRHIGKKLYRHTTNTSRPCVHIASVVRMLVVLVLLTTGISQVARLGNQTEFHENRSVSVHDIDNYVRRQTDKRGFSFGSLMLATLQRYRPFE
jgi:hypothetical protein